jgi:hypothetical protein
MSFFDRKLKTFDNQEYNKEIFDMMCSPPVYKSDKYEVSFKETNPLGVRLYTINFEAFKEKIKIEILRSPACNKLMYIICFVKFKDELIFYNQRWSCSGHIEQRVYDILNDFSNELEEFKEKQRIIENEKYEKYKLEQKKRCERINKEFLELKRGS